MDRINVKQIRTAKKYSEALFDIAKKQGKIQEVLSDINFAVETFKSSQDLLDFLDNPVISQKDKKDVLKELFETKISPITLNFLYVLTDNSRFDIIEDIKRELWELERKDSGVVTVKATSAVIIKDYLREKLKTKLEFLLSKQVQIEYEVNPSIIAGLIVEIEGKTIDNSVRTKLKNIKKQLI